MTNEQDLINLQAANIEMGGTRTYALYNTRTEFRDEFRFVIAGGIFWSCWEFLDLFLNAC